MVADGGIDVEDGCDHGSAHPHTVSDLVPVLRLGKRIEFLIQLTPPGKRVQDRQVFLGAADHVVGQAEAIIIDGRRLTGHVPFVLKPRHVHRIAIADMRPEIVAELVVHAVTGDVVQDVLTDLQLRRCDEQKSRTRVATQQIRQGTYRPSAFEITDEGDGLARERVPRVADDAALRGSINAGIVYAVAAGNGALGACIFPANASGVSPARVGDDEIDVFGDSAGDDGLINGVITTTSHNSSFADVNCNFGAPVSVAAPGLGIMSSWLNGTYSTISGTSMATPHVAGAALLYLQDHPTATPAEVEAAIVSLLKPWTTNDLPNASGRLSVDGL